MAGNRLKFLGAGSLINGLAQGLSLFLGTFCLLNLAGELYRLGFDANLFWIDIHWLPRICSIILLAASGAVLLAHGLAPGFPGWRRKFTTAVACVLAVGAAIDSVQFYILWAHGAFSTSVPLPLSLFLALGLGGVAYTAKSSLQASAPIPESRRIGFFFCFLLCGLFPLMQMWFFGKTDYRRPADAAVVLGARAYADGRPSDALADRVRTACGLYRNGTVKKLIFSGGPGDGSIHETEAMRQMALQLGVKEADMILDQAGLSTQLTVENTASILKQLNANRVIVVSHFYHLPRLKLAYRRAGREVWTVPAEESYFLRQLPFNMGREIVALWVYYFRPLAS